MKLGVACCTYLRPTTLGELICSYERQDYPLASRSMIVLDDAGQYTEQSGPGWRLVSVAARYCSLGEKRNAAAALLPKDVDAIVIADDDDIYLPHWLSAHASALANADWSVPSQVFELTGNQARRIRNWGTYHAAWAYRKSMFDKLGGYSFLNNGEDQEFADRARLAGFSSGDPCLFAPPFFMHRRGETLYQMSDLDDPDYASLECLPRISNPAIKIEWRRDYVEMASADTEDA